YEFLRSILFIVIISIIIRSLEKLLEFVLKTQIDMPEVMKSWMFAPNSLTLLITLIIGCTFAPIVEEIFFRGFLYNAIKARTTVLIAIILQAIAFAGMHHYYDWTHRFLIFVLGIALAIVYEKRHSLISPIFVHGIINARILIPLIVL